MENISNIAKQEQFRLFVDMDGTLAQFHAENNYLERMYEPGFFEELRPYNNVVGAIRRYSTSHPETEVFVLSAAIDSQHCAAEKHNWLDKHLPEIDRQHRVFVPMGEDKAAAVPGGIRASDTLLDDYNVNLDSWQQAGGRSVKCVNHINHRGLNGELWNSELVHYNAYDRVISGKLIGQPPTMLENIRTELQELRESDMPSSEIASQMLKKAETFKPDPQEFRELLDFRAKFYKYSFRNSMLISMRNFYATYVGSYTHMKSLGYTVKQGEKGMAILKPAPVRMIETAPNNWIRFTAASKEQQQAANAGKLATYEKMYYKTAYVYDISQTDCPREDLPKLMCGMEEKPQQEDYYNALCKAVRVHGIAIDERSLPSIALAGFFEVDNDRIVINASSNPTNRLNTLAHEFGHALLHKNNPDMPEEIIGFEAEAVAYITLKQSGFDMSGYSFSYIADNLKHMDSEQIRQAMNRIDKCAVYMTEQIGEQLGLMQEKVICHVLAAPMFEPEM